MTDSDAALAARLATEAGELLLSLREAAGSMPMAELKAMGDRRAHEYLRTALAECRPDDVMLSEEGKDDPRRLTADRVWIVDPLDGTNEYGEGRSDWAVHVALWERHRDSAADESGTVGELTAGAVALPGRSVTLSTLAVSPSPDPADASSESGTRPWQIAVSRSRAPEVAEYAAAHLGAELVPLGSAGYKVASVVLGEVDAYVHAGGQYEWDSAAPVAVARAAGFHASRLDGGPLRYNAADPYLPDVLVARAEIADALVEACAANPPPQVSAVPRSTR